MNVMRIWDIQAGYLNRQSLLGEHRELHGIVSIITNNKKGYSCHPETLRWVSFGWALRQRHQLLSSEMSLRGFVDRSPIETTSNEKIWPTSYIDEPYAQFQLITKKYIGKEQGRIPLPKNGQQLWSHHKYSVLARDVKAYKQIGKNVALLKSHDDYSSLAKTLTELLRISPTQGGIRNSLQHMWGYVSNNPPVSYEEFNSWSLVKLYAEIQQRVMKTHQPYLYTSTALSELKVWL